MIKYTAIVTVEEIKAAGCITVYQYLSRTYPNINITESNQYGNNIHVEAEMPQWDYTPIEGIQYYTTSFEEIREEIYEDFA